MSPVLLSHLAESLPRYHRSWVYLAGTICLGHGVWVDALAALSTLTFPLPDYIKTQDALVDHLSPRRRWGGHGDDLPRQDLRPTIRQIKIAGQSCPANLTGLRVIDVSECSSLTTDWLPPSSGGKVEKINASRSSLVRVPGNLTELREIDVSGCGSLAADWLPPSSRRHPNLTIDEDSSEEDSSDDDEGYSSEISSPLEYYSDDYSA